MDKMCNLARFAALGIVSIFLVACGSSGSGDGAPSDATITANPTGYSVAVTAGGTPAVIPAGAAGTGYFTFTVSVTRGGNDPINNVPVWVYAREGSLLRIENDPTEYALDRLGVPVMLNQFGAVKLGVSIPLSRGATYGDNIQFASGAKRALVTIEVECVDGGGATCP